MKLVITDLDDTILKSDDADFTVWRRHKKTGRKEKLNSEEYAKDPYKGNS
jgi:phosphoserine phosphatase